MGEEEGDELDKIVRRTHKEKRKDRNKNTFVKSPDLERKKRARSFRRRGRVRKRIRKRKETRKRRIVRAANENDGHKHKAEAYSRDAIKLIKNTALNQSLFVYLSMFTKIYPREVGMVEGKQKHKEQLRQENLEEWDAAIIGIVEALKVTGRYENSVLLFFSDNGARESSDPSLPKHNAPCRGGKGSVYEGGTRVPAFLHSPLLVRQNRR